MAEKLDPSNDRSSTIHSDWPTLIERAIDDVARIFRSEAQILEASIAATVERQISKTVTLLTIVGIMISGALCIVGAAIFLLHQWLTLWQSFGIVGLVMLLVGIVSMAAMKPRIEIAPPSALLNKAIH
jgi:CHASE2 domain-containing sensor protein